MKRSPYIPFPSLPSIEFTTGPPQKPKIVTVSSPLKTRKKWPKASNSVEDLVFPIRRQAEVRGKILTLKDEEILGLVLGDCYYCGSGPKNGIDRQDSRIGYLPENCVSCCKYCK